MTFVSVGMHSKGFNRLVRKMDEIAAVLDEEVIMQIGSTSIQPENARWFTFTTGEEIRELCAKARVVVTQPAMTLIDALEQETPVVVVPRLKQYGEVIDNHQMDLARELEKEGKVIAVYSVDELEEVLKRSEIELPQLVGDIKLVKALKGYIAQFAQN